MYFKGIRNCQMTYSAFQHVAKRGRRVFLKEKKLQHKNPITNSMEQACQIIQLDSIEADIGHHQI